jgi:hypothetical protein
MTKPQKIESILDWALYAAPISAANERSLRTQFAAMSDEEIDRRYAQQLRRREQVA